MKIKSNMLRLREVLPSWVRLFLFREAPVCVAISTPASVLWRSGWSLGKYRGRMRKRLRQESRLPRCKVNGQRISNKERFPMDGDWRVGERRLVRTATKA